MNKNGKGDKTRPKTVDYSTWDKNWTNIFGTKEKNSSIAVDRSITEDTMKEPMRDHQSRD